MRYPGYGWERNQGYATLEHRMAIRRLGLTPFHRRSFLALQRTLAGDQLELDLLADPAASSEAHELLARELTPGHGRRRDARRARPGVAGVDGAGLTTGVPGRGPAHKWPIRTGCDDAGMADRPGDPTRTTAQQAGDAAETLVAYATRGSWLDRPGPERPCRSPRTRSRGDRPGSSGCAGRRRGALAGRSGVRPARGDRRPPQARAGSGGGVRAPRTRVACRTGRPFRDCRCGSISSSSNPRAGSDTIGTPSRLGAGGMVRIESAENDQETTMTVTGIGGFFFRSTRSESAGGLVPGAPRRRCAGRHVRLEPAGRADGVRRPSRTTATISPPTNVSC